MTSTHDRVAITCLTFLKCSSNRASILVVIGAGRLTPLHEHPILRSDHLMQVAVHEDDPIVEGVRQVLQEIRDDLDAFASRVVQPGQIISLVELLDLLKLVVPRGIAFVRSADS